MNRILSIAILLLTLLTAEEMRAQSMTNETTHNCDDGSFWYMTDLNCEEDGNGEDTCSSCGGVFKGDEIAEHEKNCFYECNKCKQKMKVIERDKHKCKGDEPDPKPDNDPKPESDPGKPDNPSGSGPKGIPDQVLPNVTVNGKNKSSFNWWDWTLVYGGGGGGSSSSSNNNNGESVVIPTEEPPLHAAQQSGEKTDSIGYHRCPCLITEATKKMLNNLKEHRLYNQDNGYPNLTKDLERQLAFPEIIQQGQNGTCGPAFIQKYLAENYPKQYADCVYNLANYGYYGPWGLELAMDVNEYSPIGMTANDILHENGNEDLQDERIGNGIQYTSVDALMQSAIQTWANTDSWLDKLKCLIGWKQPGYDPRLDKGKGGGMDYEEMKDFFENIVGESAILHKQEGYMDYDYINEKITDITNNEFDSFTILAGVKIKRTDRGYYFDNKGENHYVEITGLHSGKIDFWSWGQDYTTSQYNCPIEELMIINKTDHAKKEKQEKKSLTCNCPNCTSDGCSVCMSR